MGAQATESGLFKASKTLICLLGSFFCMGRLVFSLRPCQQTFPLRLWGSHTMCWLFPACPLRCNICHSWPCSVSKKVSPLSLPSSFQLMSGKGWGVFSPQSFRSDYGFLRSYTPQEWPWLQSHGLPLMAVVLTGFQAYCSLPSSVTLGVAKPPHCC